MIDTLRTFFLIVLSILGPIAFAISVWDGFQSTLTQWICRYIQTYLWLPVSDLFSTILAKIQVLMLQNDIVAMQTDPNFSIEASNGVYIVFMIIGIIGYFTIPTVAGWIIKLVEWAVMVAMWDRLPTVRAVSPEVWQVLRSEMW